MSADTILGSLDYPVGDSRGTPVLIDGTLESGWSRTPTTVLLVRTYYPSASPRAGFRYSADGRADGQTPLSGVVTLPAFEATALGSAAVSP